MNECCRQTQVETRRVLVEETEDWIESGQSVDRLLFRLRTVPESRHSSRSPAPVGRNHSRTITSLGMRIRAMRVARRWTQAELAHRACLVPSAISHIELGSTQPSLSALAWIAKALGFANMDEFMDGVKVEDLLT